jgi:hypothetical protein
VVRTFLLLGLVAAALAAQDAPPLPRPGWGGDYWTRNEQSWPLWAVVGKHAIPARRAPAFPEVNWQEPEALLHVKWDIPRWPEVARFAPGTRLVACPDQVGGNIVKDEDGSSWLRVYLDAEQRSVGFVRCNKKWVQPLKGP